MRVVVGEDQALLRDGLVLLLRAAGFEVPGVASDGEDLVRKARAHKPDLVIADLRMPPTHTDEGLRAALEIRSSNPDVAIVVLSQHVQRTYARELLESGSGGLGGVGYLLKHRVADTETFCSDLRRICDGASILDREVTNAMLDRAHRDNPLDRLTSRQREVLELMAQGRSNAAIAQRLSLTEKAVSKHVSHVYDELGVAPAADDHRRVLAVTRYLNR